MKPINFSQNQEINFSQQTQFNNKDTLPQDQFNQPNFNEQTLEIQYFSDDEVKFHEISNGVPNTQISPQNQQNQQAKQYISTFSDDEETKSNQINNENPKKQTPNEQKSTQIQQEQNNLKKPPVMNNFSAFHCAKQFECSICYEYYDENEIITLECDHKCCRDCTKAHLIQQKKLFYDRFEFELIKCPFSRCSKCSFTYHNVEYLLGKEEALKFVERGINKQLLKCPWCQKELMPDENALKTLQNLQPNKLPPQLECTYCKKSMCLKCKAKTHTLDEGCQPIWMSYILNFAQTLQPNDKWMICPKCYFPYLKDTHCDQVTCKECSVEFCFSCSAPMLPIKMHGNQYHRRECPHFKPWWKNEANSEEYLEDPDRGQLCSCREKPKICPRPQTFSEFTTQLKIANLLKIIPVENS